ncbi:MAG: molybdopterin molybdotransferase MoeA [Pseudanabaenaceae cyanobacterium bins.39]|nr:molybdopterin molybdotransferase MoeA [Pseudanabaenaceae cyanobacterium bins.39]
MLTVTEAEKIILELITQQQESERRWVALEQADDQVLAQDLVSLVDFPQWHSSAMDGYALRYEDIANHWQTIELNIAVTEVKAGSPVALPLKHGEAMRIFTGGCLPMGADTVVMQEDVEIIGDSLRLRTKPVHGEYVRSQGEYLRAGELLVKQGTRLGGTEIGAIAAAGIGQVQVYRQPRVAIMSTGDELVNLGQPLQVGQIWDSNQYALAALVRRAGAIAIPLGAVPDQPQALKLKMQQAIAEADLVISSGGVSVGDYDYVDTVLEAIGAEIHIRSVAIKPGKPLTVAKINDSISQRQVIYFGVPGNPVSAMVTFWRFIGGAIAKLSGMPESAWYPQWIKVQTTEDLHAQGRRETYLWGQLSFAKGKPIFQPVQNYSSGNLISVIGVNALAMMRMHQTYVPAMDEVMVMILPY